MYYLGIDPSFTGTGLAIFHDGIIYTVKSSVKMEGKRFVDVARACYVQVDQIVQHLRARIPGNEYYTVISENPPPLGQFASGLYALDTLLFNTLMHEMCNGVYVVNPNYLQHLHKKRKYAKSESVHLAQDWCKKFGIEIRPLSRFSADEAEATLFLLRLLVRENLVSNDVIPQLRDEKELRLF